MVSKLITLDSTCSETERLKNLIIDIPLFIHPAMTIHRDCRFVIDLIAYANRNRKMNMHILPRYKFVKNHKGKISFLLIL